MLNHKSAQSSPASRGGIGTVGYVVATGVILVGMIVTLWLGIQLQPFTKIFGR
jgi:hypothetical protein